MKRLLSILLAGSLILVPAAAVTSFSVTSAYAKDKHSNGHGQQKAKKKSKAKGKAKFKAKGHDIRHLPRVIELRGRSFDVDAIRDLALALPLLSLRSSRDSDRVMLVQPDHLETEEGGVRTELDPTLRPQGSRPMATYRQALLDYEAELNNPLRMANEERHIRSLVEFAPETVTQEEIAAAMKRFYALNADGARYDADDGREILLALKPEATDVEIVHQLAALQGIVRADDRLVALRRQRDIALAAVLNGRTLTPGSSEWVALHESLRLDEELSEAELLALDAGIGVNPAVTRQAGN